MSYIVEALHQPGPAARRQHRGVVPLPDRETPAFTDHERPLAERVGDLLGRLTIEEKIGLLHQHQPPVDRLGVGPFVTGTEALHGLAWLGPATVFPQAVGLASTWNPELVESVGAAVGDEVRAVHHKDPGRCGLNVWAPVVNLLRDPRWGRNEEGYAEDVLLTVTLGTAYARGLRGDDPRYLRTAPTLKHFLAYNNETRRAETSSRMPPRVLHEYELPVFLAPLEAGAAVAVMASYNLVNGRPAHLSPLIGDELRRCTDDEILVVSDAFAPGNVVDIQHYHPDHVTSHAALLKAGLDSFTDNDADGGPTVRRITEALRLGLIDESDVDTAARRALTIRFRLGEFDPPAGNPYAGPAEDVVNCAAHRALAREAATQCIVLLKNSDGMLPLAAGATRRVAVVGPLADTVHEDLYSGTLPYAVTARRGITERLGPAADVAFTEGLDRLALRLAGGGGYLTASDAPDGGYLRTATTAGTPGSQFDLIDWGHGVCALRSVANHRFITVDDTGALINSAGQPGGWVVREVFSLAESAGQTAIRHLATGTYLTVDAAGRCRTEATTAQAATRFTVERLVAGTEQAAAAARDADVAIVVLGNHPLINGRETEDRVDLSLPPAQEELLRAVHAANPRTAAVLTSSYPYAVGWAEANLPALLWSAHGGQEFGHALAAVLFGDRAPVGRLTQTWYRAVTDLPDLLDYDIIGSDATYLYYRGEPLYPFGHGLSYATFDYTGLRLSADRMPADGRITVTAEVRNRGERDSDEVVQLYTRQRNSRVKQPLRQLRGVRRVHVPAAAARTVEFELPAADLACWDVVGERYVVESARHDILLGRSSGDIRLTASIRVDGETLLPWTAGRPLPAVAADAYAGVDFVDATKAAGDAVLATAAGAWLRFEAMSLAGGTRCTATMSTVDAGPARVTLRADDPLDGPVIATLVADCAGDRYAWTAASTSIQPVTGPVDLYAVLGAPGVCLRDLIFTAG